MRPHWLNLTGYETFEEASNTQYFKQIKIEISFPFCVVNFETEDFSNACEVAAIKFLGGFNDDDEISRVIYLNKDKINNEELFLWEDKDKKINFINKYQKILINNNKFTIKLANRDQYEYIRHIAIVEQKIFYGDELHNK
jgi:hypothetical protein